jgi:hypothetical protein
LVVLVVLEVSGLVAAAVGGDGSGEVAGDEGARRDARLARESSRELAQTQTLQGRREMVSERERQQRDDTLEAVWLLSQECSGRWHCEQACLGAKSATMICMQWTLVLVLV